MKCAMPNVAVIAMLALMLEYTPATAAASAKEANAVRRKTVEQRLDVTLPAAQP